MSVELFDIMHLDKYAIIEEPCTIIVKNNSILSYENLYEEDGYSRWLLNLKAITKENLAIIKTLCSINEPVYYYQISHLFPVGAIWEEQVKNEIDLPVRGENVIATFDYVKDRLLCTNINIIPKAQPKLFNPSVEVMKDIQELENLIKNLK